MAILTSTLPVGMRYILIGSGSHTPPPLNQTLTHLDIYIPDRLWKSAAMQFQNSKGISTGLYNHFPFDLLYFSYSETHQNRPQPIKKKPNPPKKIPKELSDSMSSPPKIWPNFTIALIKKQRDRYYYEDL